MMHIFSKIVFILTLLPVLVRGDEIRKCVPKINHSGRCVALANSTEIYKLTRNIQMYPQDMDQIIAVSGKCTRRSTNFSEYCINRPIPTITHVPITHNTEKCGAIARRVNTDVEDLDHVHRWAVFLEINNNTSDRCTGSMITERFVLTAAHCLYPWKLDEVTMYFGLMKRSELDDCLNNGACQERKAAQFIIHEEYDKDKKRNDVALIQTEVPVQLNDHITPICLPLHHTFAESINVTLLSVGWGVTLGGNVSDMKRLAGLRMVEQDECGKSLLSNSIPAASMICTIGIKNGTDVCRGDSGAPLIHIYQDLMYVVGVVSHGPTCGMTNDQFSKSIRLSYYMDWILSKIK